MHKGQEFDNFFDLLKALNNRDITGHIAIATILEFINKNKEYKELILHIIDRDLQIRA